MLIRQGIVCVVLGLALLRTQAVFGQTKPADLPIDPRVKCIEGQDSPASQNAQYDEPDWPRQCLQDVRPASQDNSLWTRFVQALDSWAESLAATGRAYALGLGYNSDYGFVLNIKVTENGETVSDEMVTLLPSSPAVLLTGCVAGWAWDNLPRFFAAAPALGQTVPPARTVDEDEEDEELDPVFREMLRTTKPLGLAPHPVPQEMDSFLIERPINELMLVNFLNAGELRSTPPSPDAARRNCPRTQTGGTILYVDPPPRNLTIVDE